MDIKVIIPYFGRFPSYFDFFLVSCSYNPEISFHFVTDQRKPNNCPKNVFFHIMEFSQLRKLVRKKLGKEAILYNPYKLCDYKPLYGYIFSDIINDADYWGHCDIDLILGRLFDFYDLNDFEKLDKIQTQGHLSFYKNSKKMNEMFKNEIPVGIMYKQMVNYKEPCFFDEISFPAICRKKEVIYGECRLFADILPQHANFHISSMESDLRNKRNQSFYWENGKLFRKASSKEELLYIHLQKRRMNSLYTDFNERIYFTPKGLIPASLYNRKYEKNNYSQVFRYHINRISSMTINKIWIHYQVAKLKKYEKRHDKY